MPEKSVAEAGTFGSSFDQAGNVGNDKRPKIAEIDYAEIRFESGERVISDLWLRCGNNDDQC